MRPHLNRPGRTPPSSPGSGPHPASPSPGPEAVARGAAQARRRAEDSGANRASPRELGASVIGRVLILDEDSAAASSLADALAMDGHAVELRPNLDEAITAVRKFAPDVVVVDPWSGDAESAEGAFGSELIDKLRLVRDARGASPEIVVVSEAHDVDAAVDALHRGASDFLVKPAAPGRLRLAIARALERLRLLNENGRLRHDLALFAAGQRILETLDPSKLATYGVEALCSFTRADGGALFFKDEMLAERSLSEAECRALARLPRPVNFTDRISLADQGPVLARFTQALCLDLDDNRAAVLVTGSSFDAGKEESGLFLARQLQTAFRTGVRFMDAEREARRDSLTGLWNARAFQEAVTAASEKTPTAPFSVLFLDVDHFKSVNDRHGHVVGSHLLVEVAQVLNRCLREGDVVARYGGDEFTVLLPELDTDLALKVAERIRATIASHPFQVASGPLLPITVCVGVASHPRHAQTAQAILDMADRAMYIGKGSIRNSVHVAVAEAG
jgi:two-component system cell cycle response regulator